MKEFLIHKKKLHFCFPSLIEITTNFTKDPLIDEGFNRRR